MDLESCKQTEMCVISFRNGPWGWLHCQSRTLFQPASNTRFAICSNCIMFIVVYYDMPVKLPCFISSLTIVYSIRCNTHSFCKFGRYNSLDNVDIALPDRFLKTGSLIIRVLGFCELQKLMFKLYLQAYYCRP